MTVRKSASTNLKRVSSPDDERCGSRFVYRGNAVGASGRITRVAPLDGLDHVLPVQAAISLPVTGGVAESVLDRPYCFKITSPERREMFYVGGAQTFAKGYFDAGQGVWKTMVRSHVQDVHLLGGRIVVEDIFVELAKTHKPGEDFPRITPSAKCAIRGLRLDGFPVDVEPNLEPFRASATGPALRKRVGGDGALCRSIHWVEGRPASKGIAECHIVAGIRFPKGKPEGVELDPRVGNRINWTNVGTIYLGELLVSDLSRRLTMFRVRLGCPVEGLFLAGEVEGNGHTVP